MTCPRLISMLRSSMLALALLPLSIRSRWWRSDASSDSGPAMTRRSVRCCQQTVLRVYWLGRESPALTVACGLRAGTSSGRPLQTVCMPVWTVELARKQPRPTSASMGRRRLGGTLFPRRSEQPGVAKHERRLRCLSTTCITGSHTTGTHGPRISRHDRIITLVQNAADKAGWSCYCS